MGTIVKFKPNIDYYYTRGLKQYESDNFAEAICDYREAYRMAENGAGEEFRAILEVEMACCYRNLHLLREAQLMYYKALCDSNPDTAFDSILGLIDIFGTGGNDEALKYYMDMAAKRGFSRELDYIEAASQFFAQRDYRVEPSPDKNMLDLGRKLIEAEQFAFARQLLEGIPSGSPHYEEACMSLAALYNMPGGDSEKALAYLEKVKTPKYPAELLINKAMAYCNEERFSDFADTLDEIEELDPDDVTSLSHIVRVSAHFGRADLVIKFGRKLQRLSPERSAMLCYAIALSNRGDLREARKIMVQLQALYPFDARVRIFAELIAQCTYKTDLPLRGDLPDGIEDELLGSLNEALNECGNDRAALRAALRAPEYRTAILLVFKAGSENSKRILADVVAEIPFFERYIRDCLMDPGFPDADKRILLPVAIKRFRRRPLYLTCRDVCRPLFGKPNAKTLGKWREAYCAAFGAIALFGCENFEREFDAVFQKLRDALSDEEEINDAAVAAVLAHRMRVVPPLGDDECCIELFGADRETYFAYKRKAAGGNGRKKMTGKEESSLSRRKKTHEEN